MTGVDGVERARILLADHYADKITLGELAMSAGLSKYHFLRLFRRRIGLTPRQYQQQLRIDGAKQALQSGESPSQVALAFGFVDQSHFTRAFRQSTGQTPARFARQAGLRA